jgi:hypothetical protein
MGSPGRGAFLDLGGTGYMETIIKMLVTCRNQLQALLIYGAAAPTRRKYA